MSSFSDKYAAIYDAIYADKDSKVEADYVLGLLDDELVKPICSGLEIGAGTGRHTAHFLHAGMRLLAIDPSESMVKIARLSGIPVETGNALDVLEKTSLHSLDFVLALFHVVCYMERTLEVARVFQQVGQALKTGGVFIFDVWHKSAVETQKPTVRVKTSQVDGQKLFRIAEPLLDVSCQRVQVKYTFFLETESGLFESWVDEHNLNYYSPADIQTMCKASGLEVVESHEFLSKREPSSETWGVTYVARKIQAQ